MATPESFNPTPERKTSNSEALEAARAEQHERIREQLNEKAGERSPEKGENTARREALDAAHSLERESVPSERQNSPAERRSGPNRAERDTSFKTTMSEVQSQMSAPSRTFSKVIHSKGVEKTSEAVGATIARPNALLSGAVFAFVLTLAVYLVAKNIGYPLSGFESIGAFLLGWAIGIAYDFIKVMITGRK